ncbi:MAG: glycoside hydrolase family 32 protein [Bryobacteraceae bacterium]
MTRREFPLAAFAAGLARPASSPSERDFFYKPANAWAADFIPFYTRGRFYLYYLHDWRNPQKFGAGTPWYLISTADFVHFTEHGEMLARNPDREINVFTGSVTEVRGGYHIFYVGQSSVMKSRGLPDQVIMHATSPDLLHWTKIPADTFQSPEGRYELDDWRDPFVFWNPDADEYWMLVCARLKGGPARRRGCLALCTSHDLAKWEVREPFYAPGLYHTHECPDLFRLGDWWYLLFSEYSEGCKTRYRMSRDLKGPWLSPPDDSFDGRAFYAAKTASDGRRRFLFGWNPTRTGEKDYADWNWGGNLVVHEIVQESGGTLSVKVPETVEGAFARSAPVTFRPALGSVSKEDDGIHLQAPGRFGCAAAGSMPKRCKIEAVIEFEPETRGCGIVLRSGEDFESGYYVRLEPDWNRLAFDMYPRRGDVPFMSELERPLPMRPGTPVVLKIIVDDTVAVVYANGKVAMSTRMYNLRSGNLAVFVDRGAARFRDVRVSEQTTTA